LRRSARIYPAHARYAANGIESHEREGGYPDGVRVVARTPPSAPSCGDGGYGAGPDPDSAHIIATAADYALRPAPRPAGLPPLPHAGDLSIFNWHEAARHTSVEERLGRDFHANPY